METLNEIYKIAHYHSVNHDKYSVFVETKIALETFVEIMAAITFRFEDLVPEHDCMDEKHLVHILQMFFNVKDITKECQKYLPYTKLPLSEWDLTNVFDIPMESNLVITQIDWYVAREVCRQKNYKQMMIDHLPKTEEFDAEIKNLRDFYIMDITN